MNIGRGAAILLALCLVTGLCSCSGPRGETSLSSYLTTSTRPWATTTTTSTSTSTTTGSVTVTTRSTTTIQASTTTTQASTTTLTIPPEGKEFVRLPTKDKVVALTFDAAYDPTPLAKILEALKADSAQGTFFLTGEFVRDFPESVRAIAAAGYAIGNHSYSHPDFATISEEEVRIQLRRTMKAITALDIADPRPLFRFPYGSRNARLLRLVAAEGYVSYFWTIDTLDWKEDRSPEAVRDTVLDNLKPGAIVLMHVGSRQTAQVLPDILKGLRQHGYTTIGLREALTLYGLE